jgi:3-phosphoglycerate kinase
MSKLTVRDYDLKDKRVLLRADFNVPLTQEGKISDDIRIRESIPTISYILEKGAKKVILMSHLGRPKGKVVENLRMNPVAKRLEELLGQPVEKLDDCIGDKVEALIASTPKRIVLLENLRFYPQEEKGDQEFAQALARLGDIYVNDAFGTAHRAHASTTIIAKYLPSCIGFLMEKEIQYLSKALSPTKPYMIILGGVKVSDKIGVVENLIDKADSILIGGAMAYTFLKSKGESVGKSKVEEDKLSLAGQILDKAAQKNVKIFLPIDHIVVERPDLPQTKKIVDQIPEGFMGVDIGPKTVNSFVKELEGAKTVLWNGPLGIFENPYYAEGTKEVAEALTNLKEACVIVGGGDTASAASEFGVKSKLSHVSTGGGASLEFLEGKELPGIAAIPNKEVQ